MFTVSCVCLTKASIICRKRDSINSSTHKTLLIAVLLFCIVFLSLLRLLTVNPYSVQMDVLTCFLRLSCVMCTEEGNKSTKVTDIVQVLEIN